MGVPFTRRQPAQMLQAPYLAERSAAEAVREIPGDEQAYRAEGDFVASQGKGCGEDEWFYASLGRRALLPKSEPAGARGSRQNKSMTTATRLKAQPGARTRI